MLIKLWDWEKKWTCSQVFEGHTHYVMQIVINPKDNNQFASASLDRTIKVLHVRARCLYTEVSERVCVCVCACLPACPVHISFYAFQVCMCWRVCSSHKINECVMRVCVYNKQRIICVFFALVISDVEC